MRVGLVCPYAWDIPGGVSAHVHDLALALIKQGHVVSVLAPAESDEGLPDFVQSTGRPRAVKYNGSVARLSFGPVTAARVSKWIEEGNFDVLHVHEPLAPSLSVLACWSATGPIVATWHSSMDRSRVLQSLIKLARTAMEKITARIAVSESARSTLMHYVGGDAVVIPNGVNVSAFDSAKPMNSWPGVGKSIVFLGRLDEPRKGLAILIDAYPAIRQAHPEVRLLIAGPGDASSLLDTLSASDRASVTCLGKIKETDKASVLASGSIYVAPNTGGESFGIVLLEAMAAGTPVLASNLKAFDRVLAGGQSGVLFNNEDANSLAGAAISLLANDQKREQLRVAGLIRVAQFDWDIVASQIVNVYESVTLNGNKVAPDLTGQMFGRLGKLRIKPDRGEL